MTARCVHTVHISNIQYSLYPSSADPPWLRLRYSRRLYLVPPPQCIPYRIPTQHPLFKSTGITSINAPSYRTTAVTRPLSACRIFTFIGFAIPSCIPNPPPLFAVVQACMHTYSIELKLLLQIPRLRATRLYLKVQHTFSYLIDCPRYPPDPASGFINPTCCHLGPERTFSFR